MFVKAHQVATCFHHVDRFVHDDRATGAKHCAERAVGVDTHRHIDFAFAMPCVQGMIFSGRVYQAARIEYRRR